MNFQDEEPENLKIHRRASGCAPPAFLLTLLQAQGRGCNRGGDFGRIAVAGIARPLALVARNQVLQLFSSSRVRERRDCGAAARLKYFLAGTRSGGAFFLYCFCASPFARSGGDGIPSY